MAKRLKKKKISFRSPWVSKIRKLVPYLVLFFVLIYFASRFTTVLYSYETTPAAPICRLNIPETISFDDSSLTIPLKAGEIVGNNWTTYPDAVSWNIRSVKEDCVSSNIIMWAHNRPGLFKELYNVRMHEQITIAGTSGIRKYKVVDIRDVAPTDLSLVNVSDDRLTMYTCDGFLDNTRRFVIAKPLES